MMSIMIINQNDLIEKYILFAYWCNYEKRFNLINIKTGNIYFETGVKTTKEIFDYLDRNVDNELIKSYVKEGYISEVI